MLNQNDVKEKFLGLKGNIQNFFHRFQNSNSNSTAQADGVIDDTPEFTPPQEKSAKAILSDGSSDAQKLVYDNEEASMQDKSYSFDEETTDADYDLEDDLDFSDDTPQESEEQSRYS